MTSLRKHFLELDPRIPVALILFVYLVLGLTVLGFNRTPEQAIVTTFTCLAFDVLMTRIFKERWVWPLSALITSLSLSFLLNYSHDFLLLFIPVFYAIGSKYLVTFRGKHALNPAMVGVSLSLLFSHKLITSAPAYQWNGIGAMSAFIIMLGLIFVMPKINRHWLVISFLGFFTLQTALRAFVMRHHLPFETLFLGTLSSPSFFVFTFFMITDPATSPEKKKDQILVGFLLAFADLFFHVFQSYYTFFYAALLVGMFRFFINHLRAAYATGSLVYVRERFWLSGYWKRLVVFSLIGLTGTTIYGFVRPHLPSEKLDWHFETVAATHSNLNADQYGGLYEDLDPRIWHVAKWIFSVGDAVAVSDVNKDALPDIFLTNVLKSKSERAALYVNKGSDQFERVALPQLQELIDNPKTQGVVSNGIFVDYDNSGSQSLFLTVGFGHPILLKNQINESGKLEFKDVTREAGLDQLYTSSLAATFADFNKDGLLDLLILNVWPENLPDYPTPTKLNVFNLPKEEFAGDSRPFNFMHNSWHLADNGGPLQLLLQTPDHKFVLQNSEQWGFTEKRWSLAVGVADLNRDGWPDIYIANDFGPDYLYYNRQGKFFESIKGGIFGSIGRDTYKGMNVSMADFDHTGWLGVYISNVHHAYQAEGSLLWTFGPPKKSGALPHIVESATSKGVLNEDRFGWGAAAADFNNDGWADIAQANGMVDDRIDHKFKSCPDYWYVNEKVARSPPSIHRLASSWGDLRGSCIYGNEQNRLYLNRGSGSTPQFVDVASQVGITELTNSRGVAAADFENRGRLDLIVTHQFAQPTFYRNVSTAAENAQNSWIGFTLESRDPKCNREALGSRVELIATKNDGSTVTQAQETQAASGFSSQSDKRLHFGLGSNVKNVSAKVTWCLDQQETYSDLKINTYNALVLKGSK